MADALQIEQIPDDDRTGSETTSQRFLATFNEPKMPATDSTGNILTLLQALDRYKYLKEQEEAQATLAASKRDDEIIGNAAKITSAAKRIQSLQEEAAEKAGPGSEAGSKRPHENDESSQLQSRPHKRANTGNRSRSNHPEGSSVIFDDETSPSGSTSQDIATGSVSHLFGPTTHISVNC